MPDFQLWLIYYIIPFWFKCTTWSVIMSETALFLWECVIFWNYNKNNGQNILIPPLLKPSAPSLNRNFRIPPFFGPVYPFLKEIDNEWCTSVTQVGTGFTSQKLPIYWSSVKVLICYWAGATKRRKQQVWKWNTAKVYWLLPHFAIALFEHWGCWIC